MNTLKTVFGKLFKEETQLASHEVELALVDDVKTLYENANKLYQSNTDLLQKYAQTLETNFQKSADEYKKALDKYNQLEKTSKELGIALPNEISKLKGLIEFGQKDSLSSKSNAVKILSI
jgi:anion-transporting  ArsA/GET3 family ATPase